MRMRTTTGVIDVEVGFRATGRLSPSRVSTQYAGRQVDVDHVKQHDSMIFALYNIAHDAIVTFYRPWQTQHWTVTVVRCRL